MPKTWTAILNPRGPHYDTWKEILGSECVPLTTPQSGVTALGEQKHVEVYLLNLPAMTLYQRAHLLHALAAKFDVPIFEIEAEINRVGFPIHAADVIVSFDMRAFV